MYAPLDPHNEFLPSRRISASPNLNAASRTTISLDAEEIERNARTYGSPCSPLSLYLKRLSMEWWLRIVKRIAFRTRDNSSAQREYASMSVDDFRAINALQAWSNWRSIPKNIDGIWPDRPLRIIDLCCGTGESTRVLAFYAASGSWILGLDSNTAFVRHARTHAYFSSEGCLQRVSFHTQDILKPFQEDARRRVEAESVDVIAGSGSIGCHFSEPQFVQLGCECARVLKPGGLAMLDSPRTGNLRALLCAAFESRGFRLLRTVDSCRWDRYVQFCFRKG